MPAYTSPVLTATGQTFNLAPVAAEASPRITLQAVGVSPLFDGGRVALEFAADGLAYRPLPDVELSGAKMTSAANVEGPGSLRLRMVDAGPRTRVTVQVNVVA